jgi:hypothetical protein
LCLLKTLPISRLLHREKVVKPKRALEKIGALMQRRQRKPRWGKRGFLVGVKLRDASTV